MDKDREKEILNGILDLIEEYGSFNLDIDFPEDNCVVHIVLEVKV